MYAKFWIRLLSLVLVTANAQATEMSGIQMMMGAFGNNCSLNGEWTQVAMDHIGSMVSILEHVSNDPNCKSVASAISNLNATESHIQELNNPHSQTEIDIRGLQRKQVELLNLISGTVDPDELDILNDELRWTRLSLAELRGRNRLDRRNRRQQRRLHTMSLISQSTQAVLSQLAQNQRCWDDKPNVLTEVAAFGAAISQSVALGMGSGGLSTAVGAGIQLGAAFIDYAQQRRRARQIGEVARPGQATALSCAMETLANHWCDARDAVQAVELVSRANFDDEMKQRDIWKALGLLEREVPNMVDWLEDVRSGVTPSNGPVAERLVRIFKEEEKLRSIRPLVLGLINEEEPNFFAENQDDLWPIARGVVNRIVGLIYSNQNGPSNPMTSLRAFSDAPFYLVGAIAADGSAPITSTGSKLQFSAYDPRNGTPDGLLPVTIDESMLRNVLEAFLDWHDASLQRFELRKKSIIFDDPERIFANAARVRYIGRDKGMSTVQAIIDIKSFLASHPPDPNGINRWAVNMYEDTLRRLDGVLETVNRINSPDREASNCDLKSMLLDRGSAESNQMEPETPENSTSECPLRALQDIEDFGHLENGTTFLRDRIEDFLRMIIEEEVINGSELGDMEALQYLAAQDIVQRLLSFSNHSSWETLRTDAMNSQYLSQTTLAATLKAFRNQINESLKFFDDEIERVNEPPNGPIHHAKAVMCSNLISMPEWNRKLDLRRCRNTYVTSVIPVAPPSPRFSRDLMRLPFEERVCLYRDYKRRIDILQSFN